MKHSIVLSVIAVLGLGIPVRAQEVTLSSLKLQHEVDVSLLKTPYDKLDEAYGKQLEKLSEVARAKGDLDQMLFIEKEIDAVKAGQTGAEIPGSYAAVARARSIYEIEKSKLAMTRATKVRELRAAHRLKLLALQKKLTQQRKLDEAIAVKAELAALEALIRAGTPSTARKVATPAVAGAPGKLIVFGKFGSNEATTPEEFAEDTFVAVAAGYEHWLALTPDGKVVGRPDGRHYFSVPKGTKNVASMACGRHMHMLVHKDGSVTGLSNEHHLPTIPEDLEGVTKMTAGHSVQSALLEDGKVVMFGYALKDEPFPKPELLVDAVDVEMNVGTLFMKKRDGSIEAYTKGGDIPDQKPEALEGAEIVQMSGGLSWGCVFLTADGKVITWKGTRPPEDLPKIKAISIGEQMAAGQKEDGSWIIWGGGKKQLRDELNAKLKELGPLKSLAMGREFFVAIQ